MEYNRVGGAMEYNVDIWKLEIDMRNEDNNVKWFPWHPLDTRSFYISYRNLRLVVTSLNMVVI